MTQGYAQETCILTPGQCSFVAGSDCCAPSCAGNCRSIYIPRSSHANGSYWLSRPTYDPLALPESGFDIGYGYQNSFAHDDLAACLFQAPTRTFSGQFTPDRNATDILADQFGLSPTFQGTLTFSPEITNNNLHLFGAWRAYGRCKGFFCRGMLTITHQSRTLFDEKCAANIINAGAPFPPGEMAATSVDAAVTFQQALSGDFLFGDMHTPWQAGKMSFRPLSTTNLAGATVDLGYVRKQLATRGWAVFVRYRPPTGTKLDGTQAHAQYLFSPIVGDGFHHALGAGLSLNAILWEDDMNRSVTAVLEGYGTHLFQNCQLRSFDFVNRGCLSRYLLLKELQIQPDSTYIYTGNLINGINFTTRPAQVSVGAVGEATFQLRMRSKHFECIVGYEFYGRQEETVCLKPSSLAEKTYGVKGCTGTTYFAYNYNVNNEITAASVPFNIPSNATSSATTINACGAIDNPTSTQTATTVGVDWTTAFSGTPPTAANTIPSGTLLTDVIIAQTSNPPSLITINDLNICTGRAPKQIVHKGMLSFSYRWPDHCYLPYILFGVEAEGSGADCSLKQAGFWLQGGVTF